MDKYKITFETWDKLASVYQDKFMDLNLYDDTYDIFCRYISKPNPEILEIGCGPGNITRYIVSKRHDFRITAIDVAASMINLAKKNIPGVDFQIMDCRDIHKIERTYDGIICGFCLPYLSKSDSSDFLKNCYSLLKTDGILYVSAIKGDYLQSGFETGSSGYKAYVYYYDEDYFMEALNKNNFRLLQLIKKDFMKNDGTNQTHLIVIAQKTE